MKVKAQIDEWELMHEDIWYKIYKKWINITVAHKICNQTNGIEIRRISRNENIRLKKKFNDCIFPFF
jgi:glucan phosphorylase